MFEKIGTWMAEARLERLAQHRLRGKVSGQPKADN